MLKISKQGDYGLLLMITLAEQYDKGKWISLRDIAKEKKLSYRFLTQIIRPLKQGKLVVAKEGVGGGYRLARHPKKITAYEVLVHLLGEIAMTTCCESDKECIREDCCAAASVWKLIQQKVDTVLKKTTLQGLVSSFQKKK